MKYGTQLSSIGKTDRREALRFARKLGCEGLEVDLPVAGVHAGRLTREELLRKATALHDDFAAEEMDFISLTPGLLLAHVQAPEIIRLACEAAEILGVRQLRMFFAPHVRWGGPNSKLEGFLTNFDGSHDARYWLERNARELAQMLEIAAGYDVRFVFELHHGYVINSASAAMRMLEPFPADRVGILMDPGNMVFEGNEGWRNSVQIMGEYLAYIHCKNAAYWYEDGRWVQRWASLRDGIARYPEIVTALKDIAFPGYLSIEDLRRDTTPEERVGEGIAYLKNLVSSDERAMPA
jgi:sugar phosphate isomerase/epimerase